MIDFQSEQSENGHRAHIYGLDLMVSAATIAILSSQGLQFYPQSGLLSRLVPLFGFFGIETLLACSGFLIVRLLYGNLIASNGFSSVVNFFKIRCCYFYAMYLMALAINFAFAFHNDSQVGALWRYFFSCKISVRRWVPFFPESWPAPIIFFASVLLLLGFLSGQNRRLFFPIAIFSLIFLCINLKMAYHRDAISTIAYWNNNLKSVAVFRLDAVFTGALFGWISVAFGRFSKENRLLMGGSGLLLIGFFSVGIGHFQLTIDRFPFFWNVLYLPVVSLSIALCLPILSTLTIENSVIRASAAWLAGISVPVCLIHYSVAFQMAEHYCNALNWRNNLIAMAVFVLISIFWDMGLKGYAPSY